jgi:hypothetical protein
VAHPSYIHTLWNLKTPSPGDNAYHLLKLIKKFIYVLHLRINGSWDSSGSILTRILTDHQIFEVQFPAEARDFSVLHTVQTGSGAHLAFCRMGLRALSPGIKWPGHEADNSPPSSAEVENGGALPPLPYMPSWHSA